MLNIRVSEMGAEIRVSSGEFIQARVTANGPGQAVFTFACQHRPIRRASDFAGHPRRVYEWRHFIQPGDADAPSDTYALTIAFIGGITSYTFLMEKIAGGTVVKLKDFDASSTAAEDVFQSSITLFTT
jgi:hypothetical protein